MDYLMFYVYFITLTAYNITNNAKTMRLNKSPSKITKTFLNVIKNVLHAYCTLIRLIVENLVSQLRCIIFKIV